MIWNSQELVDEYLTVRQTVKLDDKFKAIDELVKASWELGSSNLCIINEDNRLVYSEPNNRPKSRVVTAANRFGDLLLVGVRHHCPIMNTQVKVLGGIKLLNEYSELECLGSLVGKSQGFLDQFGNYLTREEAFKVAVSNDQIIHNLGFQHGKLYSEHLY